jgi:hypothetical protein
VASGGGWRLLEDHQRAVLTVVVVRTACMMVLLPVRDILGDLVGRRCLERLTKPSGRSSCTTPSSAS